VAECGRGAWARTHLAMTMAMARPECEGDVHWALAMALDSGRQCYFGAEMPLPVVCGSVSYEYRWPMLIPASALVAWGQTCCQCGALRCVASWCGTIAI
jgi:hypothetical protein